MDSPADPISSLADRLATTPGAVLFLGRPGRGKSTLVQGLLAALAARGARACLLEADPGQPSSGPPATFSLSEPRAFAFLGSIDPMAVRLTALGELHRLVASFRGARPGATLVVDACGLVANAVGREWAVRQVEAVAASHVVLIEREQELEPLARLLAPRRGVSVLRLPPHPEAHGPGPAARRKHRARALETWLSTADVREVSLDALSLAGAPERGVNDDDWAGRLVGLLDGQGTTLAVGVALELLPGRVLRVRVAPCAAGGDPALLRVGDAAWTGTEVERRPFAEAPAPPAPGAFAIREKPVLSVEPFAVAGDERSKRAPGFQVHLPNGIFGDPLVHVRPIRERDGILLDLGRASSLPVKLLHRVGLVLLSHAHVDHFFGFDELLRALLGTPRAVTLVGPPGIADRVASRIGGYQWNLIEADAAAGGAGGGPEAPRFHVKELRGSVLHEVEIVPGRAPRPVAARVVAPAGAVHEDDTFTVHAAALDHRDIVSLAYEVRERPRLAVRPEGLRARGLEPGPWLDRLKHLVSAGRLDEAVELPGASPAARELAPDLLVELPGQRIVYVTDAAWTPVNRARIVELARDADLFVCEATFTREDEARARDTGHLPAFAAAELARDARVGKLMPFHLSPRYEETPEAIFEELLRTFPRVQVPRDVQNRIAGRVRTEAMDRE